MTEKNIVNKTTYQVVKGFVAGFAESTCNSHGHCLEDYKKEVFSVIDTYFPIDNIFNQQDNSELNKDLKVYFDKMSKKRNKIEPDEYLCRNKYLNQTSEHIDFPEQRCEHCNGAGAYDELVPAGSYGENDPEQDSYQISFCARYNPLGKKFKEELQGLEKEVENQ